MAKVIITIKDSTKSLFDFEIKGLGDDSEKNSCNLCRTCCSRLSEKKANSPPREFFKSNFTRLIRSRLKEKSNG